MEAFGAPGQAEPDERQRAAHVSDQSRWQDRQEAPSAAEVGREWRLGVEGEGHHLIAAEDHEVRCFEFQNCLESLLGPLVLFRPP